MSTAAAQDISEEAFLARVAELCAVEPALSPLGASVLLALRLEICSDSRTFARLFGIEHALILREVTTLEEAGLITAMDRNPRTQRTTLALTAASSQLLRKLSG